MEERDYARELSEIRSMMERSSKFLSLSGWAGILAGLYALAGAWIAVYVMEFHPSGIMGSVEGLNGVVSLALAILVMAVSTAIVLSYKKAVRKKQRAWNAASRQMVASMSVPLLAGGVFLSILIHHNLVGLLAPASLIFYGMALYSASKFTFKDLKYLGVAQMALGLTGSYLVEYGLLFWALGFGLLHIVYGIYMHIRYER